MGVGEFSKKSFEYIRNTSLVEEKVLGWKPIIRYKNDTRPFANMLRWVSFYIQYQVRLSEWERESSLNRTLSTLVTHLLIQKGPRLQTQVSFLIGLQINQLKLIVCLISLA